MTLSPSGETIVFETSKRKLPSPLPRTWQITELEAGKVKVRSWVI